MFAGCYMPIYFPQLRQSDCRAEFGHAVIEADHVGNV